VLTVFSTIEEYEDTASAILLRMVNILVHFFLKIAFIVIPIDGKVTALQFLKYFLCGIFCYFNE
jgi:hypothetical protein